MNQSKKITIPVLLALSLSTCAPTLYAADEPIQAQPQVAPVTDEQIYKDWPEVMRMVSRVNAQIDMQENMQRKLLLVVKVLGIGFGVVVAAAIIKAAIE